MKLNEPVSLRHAWIGSIAGWTFLLTAALLLGGVILAPKLLSLTKLRHDLVDRQLRLVMIEDAVQRGENLASTLKEEAQRKIDESMSGTSGRPGRGTEEVRLPPALSLQTEVNLVDQLTPPPAPYPWYASLLIELTLNKGLTRLMLLGAAVLTVLSFVTSDGHPLRESSGSLWQMLHRRYSPSPATDREGVIPRPKFAVHERRERLARRSPSESSTFPDQKKPPQRQ